jgi:hypothetical protein
MTGEGSVADVNSQISLPLDSLNEHRSDSAADSNTTSTRNVDNET